MLRIGCLLALLVLIGIPLLAGQYLPWWGTLLVVVGEIALLVLAGPKLFTYAVKRFAIGLFMTKSKVLRGATVVVHRVEPAEARQPSVENADAPADVAETSDAEQDEDDEPGEDDESRDGPRRYVLVDFTVTPQPGQSRMQFYDPSELMLVPFDLKVSPDPDSEPDDANSASVDRLTLVNPDGTEVTDFDKLTGPAHLRIVFACPPPLSGRVKFRYYFETFGDLTLPG